MSCEDVLQKTLEKDEKVLKEIKAKEIFVKDGWSRSKMLTGDSGLSRLECICLTNERLLTIGKRKFKVPNANEYVFYGNIKGVNKGGPDLAITFMLGFYSLLLLLMVIPTLFMLITLLALHLVPLQFNMLTKELLLFALFVPFALYGFITNTKNLLMNIRSMTLEIVPKQANDQYTFKEDTTILIGDPKTMNELYEYLAQRIK